MQKHRMTHVVPVLDLISLESFLVDDFHALVVECPEARHQMIMSADVEFFDKMMQSAL